jgi:hypothetical protein
VSLGELEALTRKGPGGTASSKPRSESEVVRDELERRLMATVPVTDADRQDLVQRRIGVVQKFLIEAGQIDGERLFPVAPGTGGPTGDDARVVFSLN